ncbi:SQS1_1 [Sanghuangporus weigelae]
MEVWCLLIDHEKKAAFGEAFSVIVGLDACIQDLKKKVKEERPVDLEHVDAARLTVWRCTDSEIDFADIDSDELNDRLNEVFSPDEQKVKKLKPKQDLRQLTGKTLLIEVPGASRFFSLFKLVSGSVPLMLVVEPQLATTIPSKRPRSDGSVTEINRDSEILRLNDSETNTEHRLRYLLYAGLWKKGNLADLIVEGTYRVPSLELSISDEQTEDTELVGRFLDLTKLEGWSAGLSSLVMPRFLIRKEYEELDSFLASDKSKAPRVLLIGQPGIGKTVYLTYCLLKRLSSGKRTIVSWSDTSRYLFQDNGAFWIPNKIIAAAGLKVTDDRDGDALILYDLNNNQPKPYEMRNWHIVVASSPKNSRWKEWEKETQAQTYIMKTWGWEEMYISRDMAVTDRSDDGWRKAFLKYGGSARHLLAMKETTLSLKTTQAIRRAKAKDLFNPTDVEFKDDVSSFLVEINPMTDPQSAQCDRSIPSGSIISQAILELIIEQAEIEIASEMKRSYETLMRHQGTRTAAGLLFEGVGHRWLLKACKSLLTVDSLSSPGETVALNLSHLDKTFDFGKVENIDTTKYYRPLSSRLAGVDSFAVTVDPEGHATEVILFQFIVSVDHPIKTGFVKALWGTNHLSDLKWRYIFIVPEDEASGLTEQPWAPASEASTWKRRIDQYVLGVNTKELYASLRK